MNINYKQPQFELFPANSATLEDVNKPRLLLANLTLSFESLVILSILGIMVALFSFCVGVERGKYAAAQALDERVSAAWNLAGKRPMAKPVLSAAKVMPAAKPAAVQSVAATTGTRLTLQVASYKNEEYARIEAQALRAKGFQSFLIKRSDFVLVCIGQFANADAAGAELKKLSPHYRSAQLRRF